MNANQDTRGFVIHLVTRDGAHRGWWRRESPHIVELREADVFATAHEACMVIPTPSPAHTLVGEVWSFSLAREQGCRGVVTAPGSMP